MTKPWTAARARWHRLDGEQQARRVVAVLAGMALGGVVATLALAWGTASLVLDGLQVVLAGLAFMAATLAFVAVWPQYRAFVAKPKVELWLEWAETEHQPPERAPRHVVYTGSSFVVRAVVHNDGPGTLEDATVNIVVPEWCTLEPLDAWPKGHYPSVMSPPNDQISGDGTTWRVKFSAARSNFPPGDHVFHARVTPSSAAKGDVPVLLDVRGRPPLSEAERSRRVVFSRHVPDPTD